jgi:hypothetical protein
MGWGQTFLDSTSQNQDQSSPSRYLANVDGCSSDEVIGTDQFSERLAAGSISKQLRTSLVFSLLCMLSTRNDAMDQAVFNLSTFSVYRVSCCSSLVTHKRAHHLILRTNSRKSPPSTHFSSPPPPTPSPPPEPPPLTPQPSPTSPITLAGRPPTTEPDAMTMFAGITVFGRILTFSLIMANWLMVTFSPMCTCDDIEMAWIVQPGPKSVSTCRSNTHCIV